MLLCNYNMVWTSLVPIESLQNNRSTASYMHLYSNTSNIFYARTRKKMLAIYIYLYNRRALAFFHITSDLRNSKTCTYTRKKMNTQYCNQKYRQRTEIWLKGTKDGRTRNVKQHKGVGGQKLKHIAWVLISYNSHSLLVCTQGTSSFSPSVVYTLQKANMPEPFFPPSSKYIIVFEN